MSNLSETITSPAEVTYVHKRIDSTDGIVTHAEFAVVSLRLEPLSNDRGLEFVNASKYLLAEHISGAEAGVRAAAEKGVINGGNVVGIRAVLLDGIYHDVDSNSATFMLAAREAFWEAMHKGSPKLI